MLECVVHDVSEYGIGITIASSSAQHLGGRFQVRHGDKVRLSFQTPGHDRVVRANVHVCRIWCQDGVVEIGLAVKRINPQALEALAGTSPGANAGGPLRRARNTSSRELIDLLRRVADEVFPLIFDRLETVANADDTADSANYFRALVQIMAAKQDIVERFVTLTLPQLVPNYDKGVPDTMRVPWHFDQMQVASAFSMACGLYQSDVEVKQIVENLVISVSFKHLAPPLMAASL